jgi:hypothetical protein
MLLVISAKSQYYYKDILLTQQNQDNWKSLRNQKVKQVNIHSIDANSELTPDFICTQTISKDFGSIATFTKSADIPASTLTAFYDGNGYLVKTVDTSDSFISTTVYNYNEKGEIVSMLNNSIETDNQVSVTEKHLWAYEAGKPRNMIKIKGESDTTIVTLVLDEKGNIAEEKSIRAKQTLPTIYYYYDNQGKLTDIVRYNQKAARLLPDYVFEYNYDRISSMLFVPNGSTDYQKWIYEYNSSGLKTRETCFDKKKQVVVRINYDYSFQ